MKPQRRTRPAFFSWRMEFGLTVRATADALEVQEGYRIASHEKVRTLCLPFDDPERTEPDAALARAIAQLTDNEVDEASFRPQPAQAAA
ncbi:hypothetical protein [Phenylobacterium sp.]|uniref:hypothetical protein n=1 Tax=Phenylobacterium sp. TaxID=1871053 RepID=UPI002DE920A5|nr:hypothetical protein [Phenylobacterium sp.]